MIKVEIEKNAIHYCGVKVTGHAYSDEPGRDLICAAVSTLAQTLANAIEEVGGVPEKSYDLKISSGCFQLKLKNDNLSDVIDIIFRTFRVGIEAIERTYKEYIKLKIKEVQGTC